VEVEYTLSGGIFPLGGVAADQISRATSWCNFERSVRDDMELSDGCLREWPRGPGRVRLSTDNLEEYRELGVAGMSAE
jgi:hypothetical protein